MPFPFDLTEDATSDLEEIVAYIAVDNQRAALKVADELESAFRFLADWPFAGHTRQDLTDSEEVRFWPNGRYLIVYAPTRTPLLILAVFHGSRDLEALLPRRLELL